MLTLAMRKLASIQKIVDIKPIPGADTIEVVQILGWKCVAKKGEFSIGAMCVYFEIDSLLPVATWSEFLRRGEDKPFRLRGITLKKQLSQGLALPITKLPLTAHTWVEGDDVTELLGVKKYEPIIPAELAGVCKGNFPSFLVKSDEPRIQNFPDIIKEIQGVQFIGTLKMDGTSLTVFRKDDRFGVCSRNMELCESDTNTYWKITKELNLQNFQSSIVKNWAIQKEICGPSIQGNRMGLTKQTAYAFSLFDIDAGKYLNHDTLVRFCAEAGINTVPVVFNGTIDPSWGIDQFLEFAAKQAYSNALPAEGVVWRPTEEKYSETICGRLSFKSISNVFLHMYKE